MKCFLIFAIGFLIGLLSGYAANAQPVKSTNHISHIPNDNPLPGYYERQLVVDPLLGSKIYAPVYHPVVIKKCYDRLAINRIPCPEDKPVKQVTIY